VQGALSRKASEGRRIPGKSGMQDIRGQGKSFREVVEAEVTLSDPAGWAKNFF
jgi:hypothetical protein